MALSSNELLVEEGQYGVHSLAYNFHLGIAVVRVTSTRPSCHTEIGLIGQRSSQAVTPSPTTVTFSTSRT